MSRRIEDRFADRLEAGRKLLIPFLTAGDPHPEWTVPLMRALAGAGADVIELGVPFSDPMADGPVIQAASERAIRRGVDLATVLEMVSDFRQDDAATPVVLMGYLNPVVRFGVEPLADRAAAAGVDALLLVDCPPEESRPFEVALANRGIACIRLVAPTTSPARLDRICADARGFIYYVSFKGITGADRLDARALDEPIAAIRSRTRLPVAAGFGISDPQSACAVAEYADAVVIGSALVRRLADAGSEAEACDAARGFVESVRQSLDNTVSFP